MDKAVLTNKLFEEQFIAAVLNRGVNQPLRDSIIPGGQLPNAEAALAIHAKGYVARLTEQMGEIFEGVWYVLGDQDFFATAAAYIKDHPATSYNLLDYAQAFPDFLDALPITREIPFLKDISRLDWTFREIFHEGNNRSLGPAQLLALQENPHTQIIFGNGLRLFASAHRIYALWNQRRGTHTSSAKVELNEPEFLILYKQNQQVFIKVVTKPLYDLMGTLAEGMPLDEALEVSPKLTADDTSNFFRFLAQAGLIVELKPLD